MLKAILTGPRGPITLQMNGGWENRCPIWIDAATPSDERALREWLKHSAIGMFGHLIADGDLACPCDVHAALTNPTPLDAELRRWNPKIIKADSRVVNPRLPPGAVT